MALMYGWYHFYIFGGGINLSIALLMVTSASLLDAISEPFISILADKISKRIISSIGMLLFLIFGYEIFSYLYYGSLLEKEICLLILSLIIAIICCPLNALCTMSFSSEVRCTGFSLFFNLGVSIFGGLTPFMLTLLFSTYPNIFHIYLYFVFL